MLESTQRTGRGRGKPFFGSTLTTRGYRKRTEEEVDTACDRFFQLDTGENLKHVLFLKARQENMENKRERATEQQLTPWGTFVEQTETWPNDDNFRIQFSNQLGFYRRTQLRILRSGWNRVTTFNAT